MPALRARNRETRCVFPSCLATDNPLRVTVSVTYPEPQSAIQIYPLRRDDKPNIWPILYALALRAVNLVNVLPLAGRHDQSARGDHVISSKDGQRVELARSFFSTKPSPKPLAAMPLMGWSGRAPLRPRCATASIPSRHASRGGCSTFRTAAAGVTFC